jgi:hypothetical protein
MPCNDPRDAPTFSKGLLLFDNFGMPKSKVDQIGAQQIFGGSEKVASI